MKTKVLILSVICITSAIITFAQNTSPSTPATDSTKQNVVMDSATLAKKKATTGLEVKPAKIDFHLTKGESASQAIYITNNFPKTMQFKARFSDWIRDSLGGHIYLEPGTQERSCAKWMSFANDVVEVEPGKTKEFLIKMKLPDNDSAIKEMKWCLVFLETVKENKVYKPSDSSKAHVNTIFRVGIHVLQTPPKLQGQKELEMLSFKSIPGSKNNYQILCKNTGQTELECKSYIELSELKTGKKTTVGPVVFPIFPEQRRYTSFTLPTDMEKGKYSVLAVVDAGEDDIPVQASEAIIDVD
jgi:hypothetical protein